jgi:hypothetical protein
MINYPLKTKDDFKKMFNIFKRKQESKGGLQQALEMGLITDEEFYRLVSERASADLKRFTDKKISKK